MGNLTVTTNNSVATSAKFSDLIPRDVFKYGENFYIKLTQVLGDGGVWINAMCLKDFMLLFLHKKTDVRPVISADWNIVM